MSIESFVRGLALSVLAALALAAPAAAQAQAGDSEVQMFGFFTMQSRNADTASGTIAVNYGKFVTDLWQLGGGPQISISAGSPVDVTSGVNAFVRRYFGATKVQPYFGGEFYMMDVTAADFTYANAILGVKNYISERAAIDFKGGYGFLLKEPGEAGLITFQVGLTVLF